MRTARSYTLSNVKYEDFDEMLETWARRHGLSVSTQYKDEEVRSVAIVDDDGCEYQLWLELLPPDRVKVTAWDYADRRQTQITEPSALPEALEYVYGSVEQWICDDGHTRTNVRK